MLGCLKTTEAKLNIQMPNKNAYVESFFSIIELEIFRVRYFNNFQEAYKETHGFINYYNKTRIHGSIGFKTPHEVTELLKTKRDCKIKEVRC